MSCHDIGRGLNNVVRVTMRLMDEGKISKDAAKVIVHCCAKSVYWCDGNEYEATNYIRRCICGKCMRLVPKGEKLYSIWDIKDALNRAGAIARKFDLATDSLCETCFDSVLNEYYGDDAVGESERQFIEEHSENSDRYLSTGEYQGDNNGYPWGD